ncbi:MAG TPA: peroxidase family protein, partial [Herpetosiphonaceae bacterium]|nr:peroxidase family protein [Herpetosiphonaceae bacterium]
MKGSSRKRRLGAVGAGVVAVLAANRLGRRASSTGLSPARRLLSPLGYALDRSVGWDKLPLPLALVVLVGIRDRLRQKNLYDPSPPLSTDRIPSPTGDARYLIARTPDGTYNDLEYPTMGSAGTRFGRNMPLEHSHREPEPRLMHPNPRTVSRELQTRDTFKPATTLNVLAAAWLQFMTRDWFSHGRAERENPWKLPLKEGDPWHENPMQIERIRKDPTRTAEDDAAGLPPTSVNTETHWWDASQMYGSTKQFQSLIRTGVDGKVIMGEDGVIHMPDSFLIEAGSVAGWWVGLGMLHTLFMHEHNCICDRLKAEYPHWTDDDLFDRARLINAALLAKIHTVEWTPGILGHPALKIGMDANWWGLATERVYKLLGRISDSEVISGIPGSEPNHYDVPYTLTEEFVSVYRMHPLIPDDYAFYSALTGKLREELSLNQMAGVKAQPALERLGVEDILYSFGIAHPGAITLHNFPRDLQRFERPDGAVIDMAAIDIMRVREMGV